MIRFIIGSPLFHEQIVHKMKLIRSTSSIESTNCRRTGAVTVEFALVAPILFLFIFGIIEFARLNMLRNTIENAAYEGARRGIVPGATISAIEARAREELGIININNASIDVTPAVIETNTPEISVTVSVPLSGAGWLFQLSQRSSVMSRSITLKRELN